MKKEKRGGKRKGAGRKKLAPTKTVSFRVKFDEVDPVKGVVKDFITTNRTKINPNN